MPNKFYEAISKMPPLRHTVGETFDIEKSEVVAWLMSRPEVKEFVFRKVANARRIKFDPATRTWSGVPQRESNGMKPDKGGRPRRFTDDSFLQAFAEASGKTKREVMRCITNKTGAACATIDAYLNRLQQAGKITFVDGRWYAAQPTTVLVEDVEA